MKVAILKYNAGNICSVVNALERIGCNPILTDSAEELQSADKVVFPGQGAAGQTMRYLKEHRLDSLVCNLQQPVLGICIGQQLLCRHSEEDNTDCLGIFPVDVKKFKPSLATDKIPAMRYTLSALHCLQASPLRILCISFTATMYRYAILRLLNPTTYYLSAQHSIRITSTQPNFIPKKVEELASYYWRTS